MDFTSWYCICGFLGELYFIQGYGSGLLAIIGAPTPNKALHTPITFCTHNMSEDKNEDYWFPAKKYGWGWGFPCKRQGWIVMILYIGLMTLASFIIPPRENDYIEFTITIVVLSVIFIGICWMKGEPPKWRWGNKD